MGGGSLEGTGRAVPVGTAGLRGRGEVMGHGGPRTRLGEWMKCLDSGH